MRSRNQYIHLISIAKPLYPGSGIENITGEDYIFFNNPYFSCSHFSNMKSGFESGNKPNFSLYFVACFRGLLSLKKTLNTIIVFQYAFELHDTTISSPTY
jgi:hypothetical protein